MVLSVHEKNFDKEVLSSPILVIVNFWAPWCGLCRRVTPLLAHLQLGWDHPVKLVSINADDNLKLANRYRLQTLPTLMLFDQGQVIHRIESFQGSEALSANLSNVLNHYVPSRTAC
jgi:thioredoxin 1